MKVSLLLTGNELMTGDTVDSNSAYIAQSLKDINLVPFIKTVVGDDLTLLVKSIQELSAVTDVLIVNGGLGPTVDDLTAQALSMAVGSPLARNAQAFEKLDEWAQRRGFVITESNLKQAELPAVCDIIDNPKGSAVGFRCEYNGCLIMCTPGVPSELKPMVENHLLPLIRAHGAITTVSDITRIRVFGITESGLQDTVNEVFPDWPPEVDLGFRVQMPVIEVKLATLSEDARVLNETWTKKFIDHFSDYVIGYDDVRLSQALNAALMEKRLVLSTAESCTGGLIAAGITSEAGASSVFQAGYVTYSNAAKHRDLGVSLEALDEFGAVSEQVVTEMVAGALSRSGADIALAISGIAGPDGGSPDKPVGTVWMAWGEVGQIQARKFYFPTQRLAFQRTASAIAMDLVRRHVLGLPTDVDYFSELKKKR
ncbi:CinA family nicotinamide mononucleotide deamidase-related protein [Arenicella xantha]|uniref:CinA-like protein n=1 Tax=Arenicella xantha TaxID=644221 RepID=A0A395JJZ0_9GAMM|nr:CinA family nicotinamide mononucleotide deamidase-related protein [Arenicella xantha]RBP49212.1 nicotinamide-nucleotide amidase [Arenicella xantha]